MADWIRQAHEEAVEKVREELAKPLPVDRFEIGAEEAFGPWKLFPCLFGSYSSDFDDMALLVLRNIRLGAEGRWDEQDCSEGLAHHMFREMLCTAELCDYGTSPRVCFATTEFAAVIDELIEKWEAYARLRWQEPVQ